MIILTEAREDTREAYLWYEKRSKGLGAAFARALDACLASVERNPNAYPFVYEQVRRAPLRRFPYGIFYINSEEGILVFACFHASRDPREWQHRAADIDY